MFKEKLTPKLALAVALLHMANANGQVAKWELTYILTLFKGDRDIIKKADTYIKQMIKHGRSLSDFLSEANEILTEKEKKSIIINMIDIMLSDGEVDDYEKRLLQTYVNGLGLSDEEVQNYQTVIKLKTSMLVEVNKKNYSGSIIKKFFSKLIINQ